MRDAVLADRGRIAGKPGAGWRLFDAEGPGGVDGGGAAGGDESC
jgi:hypothetical protein